MNVYVRGDDSVRLEVIHAEGVPLKRSNRVSFGRVVPLRLFVPLFITHRVDVASDELCKDVQSNLNSGNGKN